MGLFGKLINLTIDVATAPIAIVQDVVTMGGALEDRDSYTGEKIGDILTDLVEIKDEAKEL